MFGKLKGMNGLGMGMGAGLLDKSPSPLGTGPTVREFASAVAGNMGGGQAPMQGMAQMGHEAAHLRQPAAPQGGDPFGGFGQRFGVNPEQMRQMQMLMQMFGGR